MRWFLFLSSSVLLPHDAPQPSAAGAAAFAGGAAASSCSSCSRGSTEMPTMSVFLEEQPLRKALEAPATPAADGRHRLVRRVAAAHQPAPAKRAGCLRDDFGDVSRAAGQFCTPASHIRTAY